MIEIPGVSPEICGRGDVPHLRQSRSLIMDVIKAIAEEFENAFDRAEDEG